MTSRLSRWLLLALVATCGCLAFSSSSTMPRHTKIDEEVFTFSSENPTFVTQSGETMSVGVPADGKPFRIRVTRTRFKDDQGRSIEEFHEENLGLESSLWSWPWSLAMGQELGTEQENAENQ